MPPVDAADMLVVTTPQLPTISELTTAMAGRIPSEHPARMILLLAFLLATVDDWIHPDTVTTEHGDTASEVLWGLGLYDLTSSRP
jgi:hypothetical protein